MSKGTSKVTKVLTVTKEGELRIFSKDVVIPSTDLKVRHHLRISPEKQAAFWALDKQVEAKVQRYRKVVAQNRELVSIDRKKVMSTVDKWFNHAVLTSKND